MVADKKLPAIIALHMAAGVSMAAVTTVGADMAVGTARNITAAGAWAA